MSNIGVGFKPKSSSARLPPGSVACKCQICNCGSHKCPPDRHLYGLSKYEADALRSEQQRAFPAHPIQGRPAVRGGPRSDGIGFGGAGPFEGQTTCQSDFVAHGPGARGQMARPPQGDSGLINGGNNQRSFQSEAHNQFAPKGSGVRESYAPVGAQHTTGAKFDGQSTTSHDYPAYRGAKPSTPFKEQPTRNSGADDRDFQTEAALKFVAHADQRRANFAPQPRNKDNVPFDGTTTTKADYPGWNGAGPARSAAPQQSHQPSSETRDFRSQNAVAFEPKGYAMRESCKPRGGDQIGLSGPFAGQSTTKSDYSGAPGSKAASARPRGGLTDTIGVAPGSGDTRDWLSENRQQFVPVVGSGMRESYAPVGAQHTTGARFDGKSTTAHDFPAYQGAKPSTPFREQPTRTSAPDDRDFRSQAALSYQPHAGGAGVRPSFQPQRQSGQAVPFAGESTTKADFKPWKPEGCPANLLPNNGVRGEDGHTLYTNATGRWAPVINAGGQH